MANINPLMVIYMETVDSVQGTKSGALFQL